MSEDYQAKPGFLDLFWETLFAPGQAGRHILELSHSRESSLFLYSLIILLLSCLGVAAFEGTPWAFISAVIYWAVSVAIIGLLAWLFRSRERSVNFALLFFFAAFAQAPLIFLGIGKLWQISPLQISQISNLVYAWSIFLWGWAMAYALDIGGLKAGLLIAFFLLGPIMILIFAIVMLLLLIIAQAM